MELNWTKINAHARMHQLGAGAASSPRGAPEAGRRGGAGSWPPHWVRPALATAAFGAGQISVFVRGDGEHVAPAKGADTASV